MKYISLNNANNFSNIFHLFFHMGFNHKIFKELLEKKNISRSEMSFKIGKSSRTLANYISGETAPDMETLQLIAEMLQVSMSDLFEDSENKEHKQTISEFQLNKESVNVIELHHKIELLNKDIERLTGELKSKDELLKSKDEVISAMKQNNTKKNY
jgi:transcriptional regulator with XRE-family HTH domain